MSDTIKVLLNINITILYEHSAEPRKCNPFPIRGKVEGPGMWAVLLYNFLIPEN